MKHEELEALWRDPESWRLWGTYVQSRDPRVIVPKRIRWTGWTLNFGHRLAFRVLVGIVLLVCLPILAPLALGAPPDPGWLLGTMIVTIVAVIALCHWESTRNRS